MRRPISKDGFFQRNLLLLYKKAHHMLFTSFIYLTGSFVWLKWLPKSAI